ncbi:azurin [Achromobacter xylosoxidans]|uniref:azurin n=1 Tax=Alcaligenes xylosoxydans xylosoxydans TaxID=85698 RepID=UPI0006BED1C6|nr:azurin [Achromobacter xylosoxidans]CUI36956.1 Azurin precursor [Achromobacter xylosoxidans]
MHTRYPFALAALLAAGAVHAAAPACSIDVEGQPGKKFAPAHIVVPATCQDFTVRLIHTGKNNKEKAGHNWVLTRTEDIDAVMVDGMKAGAAHDFLAPGDGRTLARTPMLGGGETASVTFPVSRLAAGQSYTFYCSFPAHAQHMRGTLALQRP